MKKLMLIIPALFLGLCLVAQPPKGPANKGMTFGQKTTAEDAVSANDLGSLLAGKENAEVKITGKVVEVCKMEGCWIMMETANGPMRIKMKDHKFLVPLSLNGKTIVANGTAILKETSVEKLRHYAEDAGKSKDEIAAITAPKKEITFDATGILVVE